MNTAEGKLSEYSELSPIAANELKQAKGISGASIASALGANLRKKSVPQMVE